jgi:muconolactone delta-isomerase
MKLLAIGTWDPRDTNIPRLLAAEQQRTGELMAQGLVQQLLLRADGAGGYMVLNADSIASAREQLDTLPFMKDKIMQLEIVELR